tara:strand:- start:73 stop:231 length:159 start_codon:yes stop_codon:yes gene_type:complete
MTYKKNDKKTVPKKMTTKKKTTKKMTTKKKTTKKNYHIMPDGSRMPGKTHKK